MSEAASADGRVLRVLVADDHDRMRSRIAQMLREDGLQVVGEAGTADQTVELTLATVPDVVVLDVHMPGGGIDAAEQLTRRLPQVPILMLTQSGADDDLFGAIRAGASGYLLKDLELEVLPQRIRELASGRGVLSGPVATRLLDEFRAPSRARAHRSNPLAALLSPREWEVMELLMQDHTTEEVAARLYLSPTTVRVHVSSAVRKLRVKDRDAAIARLRASH